MADKASSLFVATDKDDCDSRGVLLQCNYSSLIASFSEESDCVWFDLQLTKHIRERSMVGLRANELRVEVFSVPSDDGNLRVVRMIAGGKGLLLIIAYGSYHVSVWQD